MVYIYSNFVSFFQCEMCGACCRNNWMVTVDQACYQRNADLFYATGRAAEFYKAFLPLESSSSEEYAMIAKQLRGQCWFLQPDNLCQLHKEAGHEHLDVVCKTFPRYPMDTARGIELTLSFSCPAVLNLASKSYMDIIRSEVSPVHLYPDNFVIQVYPQQYPADQLLYFYFELEQHFIDILQWRSLSLSDRIKLICTTVDKLTSVGRFEKNVGREVTRLIFHNYEQLDIAGSSPTASGASDILLENYLVNTIFKKILYDQGLKRGIEIVQLFWHYLHRSHEQEMEEAARYSLVREGILELEFEYSHHRSRFTNRQWKTENK